MSADLTPWLSLVTSEHAGATRFIAALSASIQGLADQRINCLALPGYFDLDLAEGQQLDVIGEWVGVNRELEQPLPNVYFSFDTPGLGFDVGVWFSPYDPTEGLVNLPDAFYKPAIRSKIQANHWDGLIDSAVSALELVLRPYGLGCFINDHMDMSMTVGVYGGLVPNWISGLLVQNKLSFKPEGVHVNYVTPSVPGAPLFGFDMETAVISGFDRGSWPIDLGVVYAGSGSGFGIFSFGGSSF